MTSWVEGDGNDVLADTVEPSVLADTLARVCRWPDPKAFALLPVWHPETARKQPLFTKRWSAQMTNRDAPKFQTNDEANRMLTKLVARNAMSRPNWTCCHIWGNDDARFQSNHSEVNDPRFYSCPANMVLLPTPLKGLTDAIPEVKAALRWVAYLIYGFIADDRIVPSKEQAGPWLPERWRNGEVPGIVEMTGEIEKRIMSRFGRLRADFREAPNKYPRDQVHAVVSYWRSTRPGSLLDHIGDS